MISDAQMNLMVSLKVPYIIMETIRETGITPNEAFEIFYGSETYRLLSDKETYYWGGERGVCSRELYART